MIENGEITMTQLEEVAAIASDYNVKIVVDILKDRISISFMSPKVIEMTNKPDSMILSVRSDDEFRKLQEDLRKEGWAI